MSHIRVVIYLAIGAMLWTQVATANTITAFGLQYSSVGNATLSTNADGSVQVSNIGTTGADGVAISLPASLGPASPPTSFALDTGIALGSLPVGGYIQQTTYGAVSGGVAPLISTMTETQQSGGVQSTADFSNSSNGLPLTINYYSGGPSGVVVHTEQSNTPSCVDHFLRIPDTMYDDWNYSNWPDVATSGDDSNSAFGQIVTPSGTILPASDNINFIDVLAPTNLPLQSLDYSSIVLTAGGGASSFAITGEALAVPEPASMLLAASAMLGLALGWLRQRGMRTAPSPVRSASEKCCETGQIA